VEGEAVTPPRLTVLIYTARTDYPFLSRPDLHCFDPVTQTLAAQTFRDFELVLVDALWEDRSGWFAAHPQPYPVKHVPSSPNLWHLKGRPGLCAQLNRGLAWADGQLVWIGAENHLYPPHFLDLAWRLYEQGSIPVAWYAICDADIKPVDQVRESFLWKHPPVTFNLLGWTHESIYDVDHRAQRFVDDPALVLSPCHHQHYFAYSSIPLELAYALNGFDEAFDGDMHLLDVDMGSRIQLAYGDGVLAMHRDLWLMEPPAAKDFWTPKIRRGEPIKCSYAMWWYNRLRGRARVNVPYPADWVDFVKERVCRGACLIKDRCSTNDPEIGERKQYPFCESVDRELRQFWLDNLPVRDLEADAATRRRGEAPFDRGYMS
jgi:glycosyltransferase involved in cell wall biosynthesis